MGNLRYKKLTKEQILLSADRLTRFKNPAEKYFRVFSDIILSNLIEPSFKKAELAELEPQKLRDIAVEIFNGSLDNNSQDFAINKKLLEYEKSIYFTDEYSETLLDNRLNYNIVSEFITENSPVNLKWLKSLKKSENQKELREKNALKYPLEKIVLAEGLTEEILLPAFSKFLGKDFDKKGIHIIQAGGKNQVVKMYYKLSSELKIPIFVLLDKDAEDNIIQITPRLREIDVIHTVKCGEFEDLLPHSLIIKTVNKDFKNFLTIKEGDLDCGEKTAKILEELFKTRGLHEFKKAEFARLVSTNISSFDDISSEITEIINELFT